MCTKKKSLTTFLERTKHRGQSEQGRNCLKSNPGKTFKSYGALLQTCRCHLELNSTPSFSHPPPPHSSTHHNFTLIQMQMSGCLDHDDQDDDDYCRAWVYKLCPGCTLGQSLCLLNDKIKGKGINK